MPQKIVEIDTIQAPIARCPGFEKKQLATYKLDIMGLCQFQCAYCSSNAGNYLRINRERFKKLTKQQLGIDASPIDDPALMFVWPDILRNLDKQLGQHRPTWGQGQTLVFSMLTDGFSPYLVKTGLTEQALNQVLEKTRFRIRILTKSAIVGSAKWIDYFKRWPNRFVVGLSIGTLNDAWARKIEKGTSLPSARLRALRRLQAAGVPTFGMLCPLFPDVLENKQLEQLLDAINPGVTETIWAEPFNDRQNWRAVRRGYDEASHGYEFLTQVYAQGERSAWSRYATETYRRLAKHAASQGWLEKLRYLLYEKDIGQADAQKMAPFASILFQGKQNDLGISRNSSIARIQNVLDVVAATRGIAEEPPKVTNLKLSLSR